jgi:glycosyltransferase involved in cell wall biosynthesis
MNITHVCASIEEEASGPSYSIPSLATAEGLRGHDVKVLSIGPAGFLQRTGFQHHRFKRNFETLSLLRQICFSQTMFNALCELNTEIIHTHGLWTMPSVYGAWSKKQAGAKHVFAPRGMVSEFSLSFSPWKKKLFGAAVQWRALHSVDMFHATSEQEYHEIRAYGYKQPVAIVINGIDMPDINTVPPSDLDRQILYIGRIHPKKKISDLVLAWSRLENSYPAWRLRIIGPGEGDEIEVLRSLIRKHILKRVTIEPPLYGASKVKVYTDSDVFVLPTGNENFAMTVAEALACATPVICTKGAPWSGLETHRCGWWTEIGDGPIEKALREAMELPSGKLSDMGLRGRAWMERDFSWADVALQMECAYLWLLGQSEKPACVRID